jgi:hypothetical protein
LPWRPSENFVFSCGNYFCPLFCIWIFQTNWQKNHHSLHCKNFLLSNFTTQTFNTDANQLEIPRAVHAKTLCLKVWTFPNR